jgi:hypothetical protein
MHSTLFRKTLLAPRRFELGELARPAFRPPRLLDLVDLGRRIGPFKPPLVRDAPWLLTGRSRPRYFDGRFLAARDVERDQAYLAQRLADHRSAAGHGVIHGLEVTRVDDTHLAVSAGAAITPGGRAVVLREDVVGLPLADAAQTERLDRELGLLRAPRDLPRRRTGVFVLLARPCDFTADPIGLYPASIEARRAPEDGVAVEAAALTLAPYRDATSDADPARQRSALARRIFVEAATPGLPVEAVPLALIGMERGFVRWIDPWLVRRELGAARAGAGAASVGPAAVLEAYVHQFDDQLAAILAQRGATTAIAASDEVYALPPAGRVPPASLDLATSTEVFFPPAMPVVAAVVPHDEVATIIAETLALPPFDLLAPEPELASTPAAVLIAAPRPFVEMLEPELRSFPLRSRTAGIDRRRLWAGRVGGLPVRFLALHQVETRGAELLERLAEAGVVEDVEVFFARQRRADGATLAGIVPIERQGRELDR